MTKLQAVRGMRDILMEEIPKWQFLEELLLDNVKRNS